MRTNVKLHKRAFSHLKVGDKIVSVNGVNVESVTREEFVRLFADAAKERLVIEVIPDAAAKILSDHESPRSQSKDFLASVFACEMQFGRISCSYSLRKKPR